MSVIARDCVFFYGHSDGEHACFSQFYPSEFTAEDGTKYTCAEQYMMASKARVMGDAATEKEILACGYDPKGIKDLGRQVTPFDEATWARVRQNVVAHGSFLKFSQNEPLRHILLGTNKLTLVEAAPNDAIWGIGISVKDAAKGAKWQGTNLLGKALMRARAALAASETVPAPKLLKLQAATAASSAAGKRKEPAPLEEPPVAKKPSWGENSLARALPSAYAPSEEGVFTFNGEWDEEGVSFYQAFHDGIADWAVENQRFGGPHFNPTRMTWIKPSFAWVLYRAGYGRKHSQERILKVKLPHAVVAELLSGCACKHGGGGTKGRVQWDPARDLLTSEDGGKQPRKMLRERAIQIGLSRELSEKYVAGTISITDVTELSHKIGDAHGSKDEKKVKAAMEPLLPLLPKERPYMPALSKEELVRLQMARPSD